MNSTKSLSQGLWTSIWFLFVPRLLCVNVTFISEIVGHLSSKYHVCWGFGSNAAVITHFEVKVKTRTCILISFPVKIENDNLLREITREKKTGQSNNNILDRPRVSSCICNIHFFPTDWNKKVAKTKIFNEHKKITQTHTTKLVSYLPMNSSIMIVWQTIHEDFCQLVNVLVTVDETPHWNWSYARKIDQQSN